MTYTQTTDSANSTVCDIILQYFFVAKAVQGRREAFCYVFKVTLEF